MDKQTIRITAPNIGTPKITPIDSRLLKAARYSGTIYVIEIHAETEDAQDAPLPAPFNEERGLAFFDASAAKCYLDELSGGGTIFQTWLDAQDEYEMLWAYVRQTQLENGVDVTPDDLSESLHDIGFIRCMRNPNAPLDQKSQYQPGDFVLYFRNPSNISPATHVEIGVVKRVCEDGCFVAYHLGDTCAKTPYRNLCKLANEYAIAGLLERSRQLGKSFEPLADDCEDWATQS